MAVSGDDLALSFRLRDGPEWLVTAEDRAQVISWLHQAVGLASVAFLRKEIGLQVAVSGDDLALSFRLRDGPEWLVTAEVRAQAISWLHQAVGLAFFAAWKAQPNQGKAAPLIASGPSALAPFNRFSSMRFCDWRFLHRARLNLIPTNAVKAAYFPEVSARCRVCGYEQETLPHILCSCWRHSALLNRRHNTIQEAVVDALPDSDRDVLVNQCPTAFSSTQRVDLTVLDRSTRSVVLVDFKTPFESSPEAFEASRQRNNFKYAELAEAYRRLGFSVNLRAICVGALGTWDAENDRVLKLLQIPKRRWNTLKTTVCRSVLHFSRNMWVQHCTGRPQTF